MANIILAFLPTGPSIEEQILEAVEKGFIEVNSKLDGLKKDVEGLGVHIKWVVAKQTFDDYVRKITTLNDLLKEVGNTSMTELIPKIPSSSTGSENDLQASQLLYEHKKVEALNYYETKFEHPIETAMVLTSESLFDSFIRDNDYDYRKVLNLGNTIMYYLLMVGSPFSCNILGEQI